MGARDNHKASGACGRGCELDSHVDQAAHDLAPVAVIGYGEIEAAIGRHGSAVEIESLGPRRLEEHHWLVVESMADSAELIEDRPNSRMTQEGSEIVASVGGGPREEISTVDPTARSRSRVADCICSFVKVKIPSTSDPDVHSSEVFSRQHSAKDHEPEGVEQVRVGW